MPTDTTSPRAPSGSRSLEHPAREDIRIAEVLHALADPMRLRIVRALAAQLKAEVRVVDMTPGTAVLIEHKDFDGPGVEPPMAHAV